MDDPDETDETEAEGVCEGDWTLGLRSMMRRMESSRSGRVAGGDTECDESTLLNDDECGVSASGERMTGASAVATTISLLQSQLISEREPAGLDGSDIPIRIAVRNA